MDKILNDYIENNEQNILLFDEMCKKILFLISNSEQNYDNEFLISYLITIFYMYGLFDNDNTYEYVIYMLIKCLRSKDKQYFKKENDYYIFTGTYELN